MREFKKRTGREIKADQGDDRPLSAGRKGPSENIMEAMNYSIKAGGKRLPSSFDAGDLPAFRI